MSDLLREAENDVSDDDRGIEVDSKDGNDRDTSNVQPSSDLRDWLQMHLALPVIPIFKMIWNNKKMQLQRRLGWNPGLLK